MEPIIPASRVEPGPGQESVWDYPTPPRIERAAVRLAVVHGGQTVAETDRGLRVLQTGQPPSYYFPPDDVRPDLLVPTDQRTFCEWKGLAHYWSVRVDDREATDAAWSYPTPDPDYRDLADHLAFFPQFVDRCTVDGERARPTDGTYYGGWITAAVVGPFGPAASAG